MTLPIPLSVQLSNSRAVRHVERDLRSLSFRSVVPGGFASAQFSLDRPLSLSPDELAYYTNVDIYDARNGTCVWCGRLEDPGRGVGADGQVWDLAAVGPSAHLRDSTLPLVYAYRDLAHWKRGGASKEAGRDSMDEQGSPAVSALLVHAPPSSAGWSSGDTIRTETQWVHQSGQNLARVNWQMVGGTGTSLFVMEGFVRNNGSTQIIRQLNLTNSVQGLSPLIVTTNWTHPMKVLVLRLRCATGTAITSDSIWAKFWDVRVRSTLYSKAGLENSQASNYTTDTVFAHEIVADLLGRVLDQYDGANASIATTTTAIEHLAWPDGVTPFQVFEDLALFEPDHYPAAWERNSDGKHRFEYVPWPTTVAYEADASDGYSSTGSAAELFNQVSVRWRDASGRVASLLRTNPVPELTAAGITRTGRLDLGDNASTAVNAANAGDNFLAQHAVPKNAGTLTVARPIYDHSLGRAVMPWEIRPGKLIRVRGIQPSTDSLNATGSDGVTVFRLTAVDYDTASASARLELDSPAPSLTSVVGSIPTLRPVRRR